jgi:hypothetical protein
LWFCCFTDFFYFWSWLLNCVWEIIEYDYKKKKMSWV